MTTTVTVVVLHKPRHHQTADMARQRACPVNGDSQDAKRDPAAPDFDDHAMKEREQQEARGTKAPPPQGQVRRTMPIPLPEGPTTRDDDNTTLHQWERPRTLTPPPIHEQDEHTRTAATPPPTYGGRRPPPWMDDKSHPVDGQQPPTNDDPKPPQPAPATPYGRPPLVNHDCPRKKTAHGL
ncbi:hypothetical protein K443DRAFT_3880 [Laccaria amethystina LaAM-08-1]|uniref:Unplaced genomic scaffold K443scaffold_25, whole genome shotgun sequence n=1 Tax=Laccaria amethystina LaAM-08-1 TaxID=1095629 RepID=A0A0C9WZY5_9AGAR|nr:hypothetical protein K443DRAFT_3880 [Laccaria amethystina LaAM-08-1]